MLNHNASRDAILNYCQIAMLLPEDCTKRFFYESLEDMEVHCVPRLLILLDGRATYKYVENDRIVYDEIEAPGFLYCSQNGFLMNDNKYPQKTLSFSFYSNYIRSMYIDFDGTNQPPTERDLFFHSSLPLLQPGMQLLELIQTFHEAARADIAGKLLKILLQLTMEHLSTDLPAPAKNVRPLWQQINTFIREHRNEPITRKQLAKLFIISPGYVSQLCREYVGKSFSELKLSYQFERAEKLLRHTRLTIDEIALQCGFSGANYFIRRFKKEYGITPNHYRNHPQKES